MKHIFLFLTTFITLSAFSQIAGSDCFLQGNYVEVGINQCGAYGSQSTPPSGYHWNGWSFVWGPGLGFVVDHDKDGWTSGYPEYCGDYFVPGSPVEGWAFQIGYDVYYNSDQSCSSYSIPGTITGYNYSSGVYTGTWEGDIDASVWPYTYDVHITQETKLPENASYFVTKVTICNEGTNDLVDVFYERNVDPDNEQPWSGDFTTYNEIVHQPPADNDALVISEGLSYGCFLGLGARDPNSQVVYGNFWTTDGTPRGIYEGTEWGYYWSGNYTSDIANSIAFKIPIIPAGECRCVAFAYILNQDDLDDALDATLPLSFMVDGVPYASGSTVAVGEGVPVTITVIGDPGYTFTWSPPAGLSSTTGSTVTATVSSTTTYTINGDGDQCGNVSGTITLEPVILPVEISYFGGQCNDGDVILQWETLSELNSDKFYIERSNDGQHFETIGSIPAAGYSSSETQYVYLDKNPNVGLQYYRLREVDFNGAYQYSAIINSNCTSPFSELQILSAMITDIYIDIHFTAPHDGDYMLELYDMNGNRAISERLQCYAGNQSVKILVNEKFARQYFVLVVNDMLAGDHVGKKVISAN
ncbi:MAG: hypothetical protein ACKVPJ_02815 [Chitinophagales bacterium]